MDYTVNKILRRSDYAPDTTEYISKLLDTKPCKSELINQFETYSNLYLESMKDNTVNSILNNLILKQLNEGKNYLSVVFVSDVDEDLLNALSNTYDVIIETPYDGIDAEVMHMTYYHNSVCPELLNRGYSFSYCYPSFSYEYTNESINPDGSILITTVKKTVKIILFNI